MHMSQCWVMPAFLGTTPSGRMSEKLKLKNIMKSYQSSALSASSASYSVGCGLTGDPNFVCSAALAPNAFGIAIPKEQVERTIVSRLRTRPSLYG